MPPSDQRILSEDFLKYARTMAQAGKVLVYGRFDNQMVELIEECVFIASKTPNPVKKGWVKFLIDSDGGEVPSLTAIRGLMLEYPNIKFWGHVKSRARSCGFQLLQYCDWRTALSNSFLLVHYGSAKFYNLGLGEIVRDEEELIKRHRARLNRWIEDVSRRTGVSIEKLHLLAARDSDILAEEALELGFLDKVISTIPNSSDPGV
jgi:ATP-dependent protease ClpP protease subunit